MSPYTKDGSDYRPNGIISSQGSTRFYYFQEKSIQMFNSIRLIFISIFTVISFASIVSAQNYISYVAESGVDVNTCVAASPCRTIDKALSLTQPGGKVILAENGYYQPTFIGISVTITAAEGVEATIVASALPGSSLALGPNLLSTDTVTFRNLHFVGDGDQYGLYLLKAGVVNVDNCTFDNLAIGIASDSSSQLFIHNSTFRNNKTGVRVSGPSEAVARITVDSSTFESNYIGIMVDGRAYATVRNTIVANSSYRGIWERSYNHNQNAELLLDNCQLNHNFVGLWVQAVDRGAPIARLSRSTITNNRTSGLLMTANTTVYSLGNNVFAGNFPDISGGVLTALAPK